MNCEKIPFNKPYLTGNEINYIEKANSNGKLAGNGQFTKQCNDWLEKNTGANKALLTHSCTAALEMAALLVNISNGDEIIMPSYTFVSTSNAFVLQGGVPVFIDIRADTLNINEQLIEDAITPRTKAIVPVHYAGVACEMDAIMEIAQRHNLVVIEDAAQGVMASYKGKSLGSIGELGSFSFHESKNIISGQGGALLINKPEMILQSEILWDKGTDRCQFLRSEVEKYMWQDKGSSYLPSELTAAFLSAQLEEAENITQQRLTSWQYYHDLLATLETKGAIRRPIIPVDCQHNAHIYYILLSSKLNRQKMLNYFKQYNIFSDSHYTPLHSTPAGKRFARTHGALNITDDSANRIIRLPLWLGLTTVQQEKVVDILNTGLNLQ
jgi:dTDP-4-amino-4,6-dideoxygalactose transaminase